MVKGLRLKMPKMSEKCSFGEKLWGSVVLVREQVVTWPGRGGLVLSSLLSSAAILYKQTPVIWRL